MEYMYPTDEKSSIEMAPYSPKYQGYGYGKQILLWALEHIGTRQVILHVSAWNEKARIMYEKTGFEITETIEID